MCGIVGYVGKRKASTIIIEALKRLEYRGYDSAGVAVAQGGEIAVVKKVGRVDLLEKEASKHRLTGTVGIGPTRWGPHGGVTAATGRAKLWPRARPRPSSWGLVNSSTCSPATPRPS